MAWRGCRVRARDSRAFWVEVLSSRCGASSLLPFPPLLRSIRARRGERASVSLYLANWLLRASAHRFSRLSGTPALSLSLPRNIVSVCVCEATRVASRNSGSRFFARLDGSRVYTHVYIYTEPPTRASGL